MCVVLYKICSKSRIGDIQFEYMQSDWANLALSIPKAYLKTTASNDFDDYEGSLPKLVEFFVVSLVKLYRSSQLSSCT